MPKADDRVLFAEFHRQGQADVALADDGDRHVLQVHEERGREDDLCVRARGLVRGGALAGAVAWAQWARYQSRVSAKPSARGTVGW